MSITITADFLASQSTGQLRELASDPDFVEACLADGTTPSDVLGIHPNPSRPVACLRPVVMLREDVVTGEIVEILLPCGSANSLKCPSCAEFQARLRQRQIMNGLESPTSDVALFTNTAPSFGKVHRSSYSVKDAYKARKVPAHQRDKQRLTVMKRKGICPCGKFHDYLDSKVGAPLDAFGYDYAREIMWSENLPALTKSMTRTVRRLAESLGIDKKSLSLYTVYERQKRGSLHTHTLLVVDGNTSGFNALVSELSQNWGTLHNPTAEIPQNRVLYYRSDLAQERWAKFGPDLQRKQGLNVRRSLPRVRWKKGQARPGTQFGKVWDIRILHKDQAEDGELSGHQQAAGYLAKYLTKNQQATSLVAIHGQGFFLAPHFTGLRQATLALAGDRIIAEGLLANGVTELKDLEYQLDEITLDPSTAGDYDLIQRVEQRAIQVADEIKGLLDAVENIGEHPLLDHLFDGTAVLNVDQRVLRDFHGTGSYARRIARSARGLSIRLNKTLDNGGFSGALTSISNWVTSMTALKDEMRAFATAGMPPILEEYAWSMDLKRMKELAHDRATRQKVVEPSSEALESIFPGAVHVREKIIPSVMMRIAEKAEKPQYVTENAEPSSDPLSLF